jgi:CDP-glycerol glycerophosphotransferase (TagB/SpsB family)
MFENLAVVYRPHPWGNGGYKGERLLRHAWRHVVIDNSMRAYLEAVAASKKQIYLADYADTHDLLSAVDALVSPLSTIILEGALHEKPVLCLMAEGKAGSSFGLQKALVHFEDMYKCPSILMAHTEDELLPRLSELIRHIGDPTFAASLRQACSHFVAEFEQPFSQRIVDFLYEVVGQTGVA